MIPQIFVENWQKNVLWQTLDMVEQDLIISRALISLYNNDQVRKSLVFRGGTALNKLFIKPAARYSEDIDFVQKNPEPIGQTITAIRAALDNWLGEPKRKLTARGVKLIYQYQSIENVPLKLKLEINTTEHIQVLDLLSVPFQISNQWFSGDCLISTYQLEELMATKLRALYQRRKGRDLFDVWWIYTNRLADINRTITIFKKYCEHSEVLISKELFESNLLLKKEHSDFRIDMDRLLSRHVEWDFDRAFEYVFQTIISKI